MRIFRRAVGKACSVPTCDMPLGKGPGLFGHTAWCQDHTDAIYVRGSISLESQDEWDVRKREIARRLGARRWLLIAEVDAELERRSAEVLERILLMPEIARTPCNRACWNSGTIKLEPRADELFALLAPPTCEGCGREIP